MPLPAFLHSPYTAAAYLLLAYLIGAIPVGFLLARQLAGIDIREHGSGSTGATNVKRVVGNKAGLATMVLDGVKGFVPTLGAVLLFDDLFPYHAIPLAAMVCAVLGHSKSVFINFKGGKSIMTSIGCFLALQPVAILISVVVGVAIIKLSRTVSLGSMAGATLLPFTIFYLSGSPVYTAVTGMLAVYVLYLHRGNIIRLLNQQENRL
ncbi:MAG: glycerol-3-phosphate 1-O-acyltransferase PlsY [Cyanobacteria bacterium HKST-UBA05]|nr:glycerol-3-phosphate 1-O-acyltransferase PlsY [Cyanobacteria bacterium HKST-UBA05]